MLQVDTQIKLSAAPSAVSVSYITLQSSDTSVLQHTFHFLLPTALSRTPACVRACFRAWEAAVSSETLILAESDSGHECNAEYILHPVTREKVLRSTCSDWGRVYKVSHQGRHHLNRSLKEKEERQRAGCQVQCYTKGRAWGQRGEGWASWECYRAAGAENRRKTQWLEVTWRSLTLWLRQVGNHCRVLTEGIKWLWGSCKCPTIPLAAVQRTIVEAGTMVMKQLQQSMWKRVADPEQGRGSGDDAKSQRGDLEFWRLQMESSH